MKKILLVDDDVDILEPISLLLEGRGYAVVPLSKGEKTYGKIDEVKPDLILLDILMSGSDGRTICRKLKDNTATHNIPVVMMSAHPSAKKDSEQCGADDFIAKPFEADELVKVVEGNIQ
jgi:DNA-binding response OmpR family regulator